MKVVDSNEKYMKEGEGLGWKNLQEEKEKGNIKLKGFECFKGDAFSDDLQQLIFKEEKKDKRNLFDLIFLSHTLYFAVEDQSRSSEMKIEKLIEEICTKLLKEDGFSILIHLTEEKNSFQHLRKKYGNKKNMNSVFVTQFVSNICQKKEFKSFCFPFTTKLFFEKNFVENLNFLKENTCFKFLNKDHFLFEDFCKLLFIVQRNPNEMLSIKNEDGQNQFQLFLSEFSESIHFDQNSKKYFLPLTEEIQILLSNNSDDPFVTKIQKILTHLN